MPKIEGMIWYIYEFSASLHELGLGIDSLIPVDYQGVWRKTQSKFSSICIILMHQALLDYGTEICGLGILDWVIIFFIVVNIYIIDVKVIFVVFFLSTKRGGGVLLWLIFKFKSIDNRIFQLMEYCQRQQLLIILLIS